MITSKHIVLPMAAVLLAVSTECVADGGYYVEYPPSQVRDDSNPINEMVEQRALVWVRDDTTELLLQNSYRSEAPAFGWIIPVPHLPRVECTDEPILDALDLETAPLYRQTQWTCGHAVGSGGMGCGDASSSPADADAGAEEEVLAQVVAPGVKTWSRQETECLDYSVVTTTSGEELLTWLDDRGFSFPDDTAALFASYASRGWAFLVSEIGAQEGQEQQSANKTVRISWDRRPGEEVIYPMALTGSTAVAPLTFRLYVAADSTYLPSNYATRLMPDGVQVSADVYGAAFDAATAQGELVIEYADRLHYRYGDEACAENEMECYHYAIDLTGYYYSENEVFGGMFHDDVRIVRLSGVLEKGRMLSDMHLVEAGLSDPVEHTYEEELPCVEDSTVMSAVGSEPRNTSKPGFPLGAILPFLLVLAVRGSRLASVARAGAPLLLCAVPLLLGCDDDIDRADPGALSWGEELCDGADNDSDGETDEDWPLLGGACAGTDESSCRFQGTWGCAADGARMVCQGAGASAQETCNGLDDDCDGLCDDGFACCLGHRYPCVDAHGDQGEYECLEGCLPGDCATGG